MDPIVVEGLLVKGEGEAIRLILEPYCLEFEASEILDVEELPRPAGLIEGSAIPARVKLVAGARLLRIASSAPYQEALWKPRLPFALATRPKLIFEPQSEMKRREEAFFKARGLDLGTLR